MKNPKENPVGTPHPGCPDRADPSRRGDPCGRPGPPHEWWGGRPQADRPTPLKQGFTGPYGPGIFYAEGPAEKLHVIARRSKTDVAISWKGPQHGTPYQEIATACGLAMTRLWECGADSPGCVGDFGATCAATRGPFPTGRFRKKAIPRRRIPASGGSYPRIA